MEKQIEILKEHRESQLEWNKTQEEKQAEDEDLKKLIRDFIDKLHTVYQASKIFTRVMMWLFGTGALIVGWLKKHHIITWLSS